MDPQRIPAPYWRDRLVKARSMGLNTIFSYVYWNELEPVQGEWRGGAGGSNDVAQFFRIAGEEGLKVVLRPGPYVCGEREWGGFPAWLGAVPGLTVRGGNGPFLDAAERYLRRLAREVAGLQVTRAGGPIVLVQVENEYGSYGEDHAYTAALRDVLKDAFEVPLYTNDGGVEWTLKGGEVPGVLAAIDGDPRSGFAARDRFITDESELGPLLDGEYYTTGFDTWGSGTPHAGASEAQVQRYVEDLEFVLAANNSISVYMFHGGTNFGFGNGALWKEAGGKGYTAAFVTSYDYGAPLDESGRTTPLYETLREAIARFVPAGSVPKAPRNVPLSGFANVSLGLGGALFDLLGGMATGMRRVEEPVTMEQLGQSYGFVLYRHIVAASVSGVLAPGDRARDRVIVYVNGVRRGVIDSTYATPATVELDLAQGDMLDLFVENLGRVDYWSRESGTVSALEDQAKGVKGNVTVGGEVMVGWEVFALPVETAPVFTPGSGSERAENTINAVVEGAPPVFFHGTFLVDPEAAAAGDPAALDTFLAVPDGVKGVVWVNGFNLGRYWIVGPQQSLYLPGTVLRADRENEVVVLELEPRGDKLTVFGEVERTWANYADPDYDG